MSWEIGVQMKNPYDFVIFLTYATQRSPIFDKRENMPLSIKKSDI